MTKKGRRQYRTLHGKYEAPDDSLSQEQIINTIFTRSKTGVREYEHLHELVDDLNTSKEERLQFYNEVYHIKRVVDDKKVIMRSLDKIIDLMPSQQKTAVDITIQIDQLQKYQAEGGEATLDNIVTLKKISIVLRDRTRTLLKAIEQYNQTHQQKVEPFDEKLVRTLQKKVRKRFTEGIFGQGIGNQWLKQYKNFSDLATQIINEEDEDARNELLEQQQQLKQIQITQEKQAHVREEVWNVLHPKPWDIWGEEIKQREKQNKVAIQKQNKQYDARMQKEHWASVEKDVWKDLAGMVAGAGQLYQEQIGYEQSRLFFDMVDREQGTAVVFYNRQFGALSQDDIDYINRRYDQMVKDQQDNKKAYLAHQLIDYVLSFGNTITSQIGAVTTSIVTASTQITQTFRDMFSPIGQVLGVISGQMGAVQIAGQILPFSIDMFQGSIKQFAQILFPDKKPEPVEGKTDVNKILSLVSTIINIASTMIQAVTQGLVLALTVIAGGVRLFTTILRSMLSQLKSIVKTSQVMEQILSILNLVITMFFMPFMNTLGNELLTYLFNILDWARSFNNLGMDTIFQSMIDSQNSIILWFEEHKQSLYEILERVIIELLPKMIEVQTAFIPFILYFIEVFINNFDEFKNMIMEGINQAKALIDEHIIQIFLIFGEACMNFLSKHKEEIQSTLKKVTGLMSWQVGCFTFVMDYLWQIFLAFGQAIGGYIGTMVALQGPVGGTGLVSMILAKVGLGSLNILQMGALGQGIGALIGGQFYLQFFSFQEGGYIPATPGGMLIRVAEKETEYIIPQSKIHMIRGHNNLLLEINGDVYGVDDCRQEIVQTLNEQSTYSRFR